MFLSTARINCGYNMKNLEIFDFAGHAYRLALNFIGAPFAVFNSLKILFIAPECKRMGAQEKDILAGIKLLRHSGFQVEVHFMSSQKSSSRNQKYLSYHRGDWVKYHFLKFLWPEGQVRTWVNCPEFLQINRKLRDDRYDVLWTETSDLAFLGLFTNKPHVSRSHNFDPIHFYQESSNKLYGVIRFVLKCLNVLVFERQVNFLYTISPRDRLFYRLFLFKERNLGVIPLRDLLFLHSASKQNIVPGNLKKLAVLASTYSVHHNYEMIHETCFKIAPRNPEVEIHIYGSKIPDLLRLESLPSNLILRGWVENIEDIYSEFELFLVPTKAGLGMKSKVFEPLVRGKNVITYPKNLSGYEKCDRLAVFTINTIDDIGPLLKRLDQNTLKSKVLINKSALANIFDIDRVTKNIRSMLYNFS